MKLCIVKERPRGVKERPRGVKEVIEDLLKIQKLNVNKDYMVGMYNGMVVVYNSLKDLGLIEAKRAKKLCFKNKSMKKWED